MLDVQILLGCLTTACVTAVAIIVLRRAAASLGLVDRPSERKLHTDDVPLVGGLAMLAGVLAGAFWYDWRDLFTLVLLGSAAVLTLLGGLDDRYDLSVRLRLLVQAGVILAVIASTGVYIHTLGYLFNYKLELGWLGIPFTVVAVVGLVNAFNMMDGMDGLAGGMALVSIAAIALFNSSDSAHRLLVPLLLAAAVLPYMAVNLGSTRHKIFMGDAGSIFIGYLLAWTLIRLSQASGAHMAPVDVLWCVAFPVLDTVAVMYRRLRQHQSPCTPDRGHIHHILQNAGFSPRASLIVLVALAIFMAFVGWVAQSLQMSPGSSMAAFLILAVAYISFVTRIWTSQQTRMRVPEPLSALSVNPAEKELNREGQVL